MVMLVYATEESDVPLSFPREQYIFHSFGFCESITPSGLAQMNVLSRCLWFICLAPVTVPFTDVILCLLLIINVNLPSLSCRFQFSLKNPFGFVLVLSTRRGGIFNVVHVLSGMFVIKKRKEKNNMAAFSLKRLYFFCFS